MYADAPDALRVLLAKRRHAMIKDGNGYLPLVCAGISGAFKAAKVWASKGVYFFSSFVGSVISSPSSSSSSSPFFFFFFVFFFFFLYFLFSVRAGVQRQGAD